MSRVSGVLTRCVTQEADESWPSTLEVVAYFGPKRTKRRSIEIPANQFYGRGGYGAPMSGDQIIRLIDNLRRQK